MAPSPDHDKEPKAPDKSPSQISDNSSSDIQVPVVETQQYLDTNSGATGGHTDPEVGFSSSLTSLCVRSLNLQRFSVIVAVSEVQRSIDNSLDAIKTLQLS